MSITRLLADPTLVDFVALSPAGEAENVRMLVRNGYEACADWLGPQGVAVSAGPAVSGGRQAHPIILLPNGEQAVVRRYRRGGALRHLNPDRYLFGHRAFHELQATERARLGGVAVPLVLAATEHRRRIGYTALLATRLIPGARTAAEWLHDAKGAERLRMWTEAGRQIGRMHATGVAHPDLNLRNLLVGEEGIGNRGERTAGEGPVAESMKGLVYLLDFDRARLFSGPVPQTRRMRDLRRLARSARKLELALEAGDWEALREGYGAEWPLTGVP